MQCKCITETTEKMTAHVKSQLGESAKAECKATALVLEGNRLEAFFAIPFEVTADKPGYRKGKSMNMIASFCPFCGTPTKKLESEGANHAD